MGIDPKEHREDDHSPIARIGNAHRLRLDAAGTPSRDVVDSKDSTQLQPKSRSDFIARIRAEIEAGTYDTDRRLEGAARHMLRSWIDNSATD